MVTENELRPEPPYEGYVIAPSIQRAEVAEGNPTYTCVLTATAVPDGAARPAFARTLELSETQAAMTNRWRPGAVPTREQIDGELVDIGVAYMQALVSLLNHGGRGIAAAATLSLGQARSRIGMTDAALSAREH
ncbi:MAG: hypothetical protein ACYDCQ_01815 [Dehalococcoidia bacterium]